MKEDKLMQLQDKIGYHFQNLSLLNNALTHSSYANERHWKYERNNERLEFLGDAVLELVSSDYIFSNHKDMVEGKMTRISETGTRRMGYRWRQERLDFV